MNKASKAVRLFFLNTSIVALIAIWLTGFDTVHWFSYAVPAFFLIAAISGICPGMIIMKKLVGEN